MPRLLRLLILLACVGGAASAVAQWIPIGPDGGDVRSLAADPRNPDRIYLGTSAGQLFVSSDGGRSWARLAHLGAGDDYVLDHIIVDPSDAKVIYVAAWSVENNGGDVFRSSDGGKTWQALPGMHGKSVRAFAMAPRDPKVLVAGARDGVFRSMNGGRTWQLISPPHHAEIKNIESVAMDPRSPDVIYAGTWHLPWKTYDGGRSWTNIKRGVIDDSDVFSMIVDRTRPAHVYLSACSGIYVSDDAGSHFRAVQGIPSSARRTRVLRQDPVNADVVYAGTTEGLWKTSDAGRSWTRMTAPNLIINDVLIDPRNPERVLLASDRGGVLASDDGATTFAASNRGFSHRLVSAVVADRSDPNTLYAGMVNDKEFGGVFVSRDGGSHWQQMSSGLEGRDVFSLEQAPNGALLAGTNNGIFEFSRKLERWQPSNLILIEKPLDKPRPVRTHSGGVSKMMLRSEWVTSRLVARVAQIATTSTRWYAATFAGLYASLDQGKSWHPAGAPAGSFVSVDVRGGVVVAATAAAAYESRAGADWKKLALPAYVTAIYMVALSDSQVWLATREGAFWSSGKDGKWEHVIAGSSNITYVSYDAEGSRLLGVAGGDIYESRDAGRTWRALNAPPYGVRALAVAGPRVVGITAFDGLVAQSPAEAANARRAATTGSNNQ